MGEPSPDEVIERIRLAAEGLTIPVVPPVTPAIRRGKSRRRRRRIAAASIAITVAAAIVVPLAALSDLAGPDRPAAQVGDVRNGSIAYVGEDEATELHLYLMDPGGKVSQQTFGAVRDNWPSWAPDGTKIAFSRTDLSDHTVRLAVLDIDSGLVTYLTDASVGAARSDWSPDGSSIAFAGIEEPGIYTVRANGSGLRRIAGEDMVGPDEPHWSPDGSQIAFSGNSEPNIDNWDIYTVDADGSDLKDITPTPKSDKSELLIDWDHSGESLLASVGPDGSSQRWVDLSLEGAVISEVYAPRAFDQAPALSPDGRSILFWGYGGGLDGTFAVDIESGVVTQLDEGGGPSPVWQPVPLEATRATPAGWGISVSAEAPDGPLSCSATFPSSIVTPGKPIGVQMRLENLSSDPVTVRVGINGDYGALLIRDASGTLLQDTYASHAGIFGPAPISKTIPPGGSIPVGVDGTVLWPGPLQISAYCVAAGFPRISLPAVSLDVSALERAPSADDAAAMAVEATSPVFDACLPTPGRPATGTVPSRLDGTGPSIDARCEAEVIEQPGFDLVVLGAIAPPSAPSQDLRALAYDIGAVPDAQARGPVALSWWVYVATADAITQVRQRSITVDCGDTSMSSGEGISACR